MEASAQVVGVRTRSKTLAMAAAAAKAAEEKARSRRRRRRKKKKPSEAAAELRISYLQLRSRRVVMKPRTKARSAPSNSTRCRRPSLDLDRISQYSSRRASCGVDREEHPPQPGEFDDSGICRSCSGGRSETAPMETEIEEFFAAAERDERKRFADKYNYDIINDAPLEGRYEWVRLIA